MKKLSNDIISISISDLGAELRSLRKGDREYLWQGDEEFWRFRSPVLFPIVGSLWNGTYRTHGEIYTMKQHGFARDMNFLLIRESDSEIEYELKTWQATLSTYPFYFRLSVIYSIHDNVVDVEWKVVNAGADEMSFQIGAHPAFHFPLLSNEVIAAGTAAMKERLALDKERGYLLFDTDAEKLTTSVIAEKGCIDKEATKELDLTEGYLPIDTDTFNNDALIFEDGQVQSVTLCNQEKVPYITLKFDAPLVGLWSPSGKNAPFMCIEPWYGRADSVGFTGYFEDRKWIQHIKSGQQFRFKYQIIVE